MFFQDFDSTPSRQTSTLRAIFTGVYSIQEYKDVQGTLSLTHTIQNLLNKWHLLCNHCKPIFVRHPKHVRRKMSWNVGSNNEIIRKLYYYIEGLASLSWSTWHIAPQVFVQLLENGLNPPSPQQASCYLRRSQHVSHLALFQASGRWQVDASGTWWHMFHHVSIVLTWLWRQEVRRDADLLGELNYTYRDWEQRPLGNGEYVVSQHVR